MHRQEVYLLLLRSGVGDYRRDINSKKAKAFLELSHDVTRYYK